MADLIETSDFFLYVQALVDSRRAAFKKRCTLAFAVVDDGPYYVDTAAPEVVKNEWRKDAQVSVLCNRRTLSDLLRGEFDIDNPAAEHLFVWGGDHEAWKTFAAALSGGQSALGAQLAALRR